MGEGLRCRLIRSKPSELGQKVGNKSDKARGGDGAARAWRATAALSSPSSPAGASLVVECATVNTGWCMTLFGGPMLRLYI